MEKDFLIKSADKIVRVSEASIKEYVDKMDLLAVKMNEVMLERKDIGEFSYMNRGFGPNYWSAQINTWILILKENISEKAYMEIFSIYNWFSVNIPHFTIAADEKLAKLKKPE